MSPRTLILELIDQSIARLHRTGYLQGGSAGTAEIQQDPSAAGEQATSLRALWFQNYGFMSWAPKACNVLYLALRSSRTQMMAVGATDINWRKKYLKKEGDVVVFDVVGAVIKLSEGKITIDAKPGVDVAVNGGTAKVAREGDAVNPTAAMATWMSQVATGLAVLGQPTVPPTPPTFGGITGGAGRFKA